MTEECSVIVAIPSDAGTRRLIEDVQSAASRALKADPGDRADIVRYEALSVQLEKLAEQQAANVDMTVIVDSTEAAQQSGPSFQVDGLDVEFGESIASRIPESAADQVRTWLQDGHIVVWLCHPLHTGDTRWSDTPKGPPPPAERWESEDGVGGKQAVVQRFRSQLDVLTGPGNAAEEAINPSGINNQVITEVLREYVEGVPDRCVRVSVAYRDGSQASNPFPLRCLSLIERVTRDADIELRLALLSIRHTEMDAVVDGAWLRNAEVSRPREAALTDDFVYATSMKQLAQLTRDGTRSVKMWMFQTGLDTAVVGFYRAVVEHLLVYPASLAVIPMFYSNRPVDKRTAQEQAGFVEGLAWATAEGWG
jgi:hypothetical protein